MIHLKIRFLFMLRTKTYKEKYLKINVKKNENLELPKFFKKLKRFETISLNGRGENAKEECGKGSKYILNYKSKLYFPFNQYTTSI